MPYSNVKINGRSVDRVKLNGKTWWEKSVPASYRYIDPIDTTAFPNYTGLKLITLDGSENWSATGGGVYTSAYGDIIKNQTRANVAGYSANFTFYPSISGLADLPQDGFMFNGTSSTPVNGNLSFKSANTASAAAWKAYLQANPLTILISTNAPDASVWKPALREADGETGYWNGTDGFCAVKGGIPYLGENLITDEVIAGAYTNAWISAAYAWTTASGSASFPVPVTEGKRYRIAWDTTDGNTAGAVFRYGFTDRNTPSSSNTLSEPRARTTPQDVQSAEVVASADYLIVQVASGTFPANTAHLTVREMVGYQPQGDPVLFDSGYVDGIGWSANLLTRPNYTTYTSASLSAVETDGVMSVGITSGASSSLSYNCHVATTDKITIPANATKMIVKAQRTAGSQAVMKFGLLGDDYQNSCSGTGGVMSAAQYPSGTTADFALNLPAGFAGSSDYRAVINIQDTGGSVRTIHISKVWFESGSAPLTMGNPFSPEPEPDEGE